MSGAQRKASFVLPGGGALLAWFGEHYRYFAVSEQTSGRFALSVLTLSPGQETVPHVQHREHVGLFALSGEISVTVAKRTVALPQGGFLGIAPGTARQFANHGQEPAAILVITGPAGLEELQFRTGLPLTRSEESIPRPTSEDEATLESLAGGYGLELRPSAHAFQSEPAIRLTLPGEGKCLAVVGDLYRLLATSEDTGGRYAIWHAILSPAAGPPWHMHSREDEAFYILNGTVRFESDDDSESLGPGGFVHLPGGTKHRFRNETAERAEMLIVIAPAGFEKMLETVGRPWQDLDELPGPPEPAEIERLIEAAPKFGIELYL